MPLADAIWISGVKRICRIGEPAQREIFNKIEKIYMTHILHAGAGPQLAIIWTHTRTINCSAPHATISFASQSWPKV